jgi:4-diphosphocytidyl-2-C-methyl-D-erythritol kinase
VIVFPNSKINLGLHILRKRTDGYHDIETVYYPLPLRDALEVITMASQERTSTLPFSSTGLPIDGGYVSNLCIKAYRLLKKDFPRIPHIRIHLHKVIPAGGGLGGGSADASFTLDLLNNMFSLGISRDRLMEYAYELGSDCPYFLINKPCFATGRGEILEPIDVDLSAYEIVVVNPGVHVSTGTAFTNIVPSTPGTSLKEIIQLPIEQWKLKMQNDFEKTIFKLHREIVDVKDTLYSKGAIFASMSGSGSTVFGIFHKDAQPEFSFPAHYFVKQMPGHL